MGWYKYFSVFKFFWYGLTSRRNRKLLKMLLICIGVAMVIFWLSMNVEVQASTMNNEDVTNSMFEYYDSICIDFIRRYEKMDNFIIKDTIKDLIIDGLSNYERDFYIYYGGVDGTNMLDARYL